MPRSRRLREVSPPTSHATRCDVRTSQHRAAVNNQAAAVQATRLSGSNVGQHLLGCQTPLNFPTSYLSANPLSLERLHMPRRLRREDYTVGWVCALSVELAAAQEMLDEEHADLERDINDNDENLYALGSIGGHNIAIVCLPQQGRQAARPDKLHVDGDFFVHYLDSPAEVVPINQSVLGVANWLDWLKFTK